jgi:hypothetical protein
MNNESQLQKAFSDFLLEKKISLTDLSAALAQSQASAVEIAKALTYVVQNHSKMSEQTRDLISQGMQLLKPLSEKAESAEERKELRDAILELCRQAKEENIEDRAFLLKMAAVGGGSLLFLGSIIVLAINPKLGTELLETAIRSIKGQNQA